MGIRVELEMLAVLLLLTPLVSDGLVMPKCQVADQLMSYIPADVPDHDNLVAKLTCHAEVTSNFDTGLIKQVPVPSAPGSRKTRSAPQNINPPKEPKASAKSTPKPPAKAPPKPPAKSTPKPPAKAPPKPPAKATPKPPAKATPKPPTKPTTNPPPKTSHIPNAQTTTSNHHNVSHVPMINQTKPPMPSMQPMPSMPSKPPMPPHFNFSHNEIDDGSNYTHTDHVSNTSHTEMPPPPYLNFNRTDMDSRQKRDVSRLWTLYGVFQLADRVACTSPRTPSFNICNLSCDKLIDDDITDDINCALAIINSKLNKNANPVGQAQDNRLLPTLTGMLLKSCPNMDYNYLAECNNP